MQLTSVELHPDGSPDAPLIFSFRDPKSLNPFVIKSISGLDLDQIVPKYYGGDEATRLYNLSVKKRTLILQMGLNPNFTSNESYSDLRDAVYRTIAASRTGKIQLQFKFNDYIVAVLTGMASKVEADLTEQIQEILMTLDCKDPMLKSIAPVEFDLDNLNPLSTSLVDNKSSAPHGFSFVMEFVANVSVLTISNTLLGYSMTIRPKTAFVDNDRLYFSSDFTNKYLYRVRNGVTEHLADVIDHHAIWPVIFPGTNEFQVSAGSSVFWVEISHYETYWGV